MKRRLKQTMAVMAVLAAATFGLAGAAGAVTYLNAGSCGAVLNTPGETYELTANMTCSTAHGLIVAAPNITIDGKGFTINGGSVNSRNCQVKVYAEEDPDRMWCEGHPCRVGANDDVLDSGVVNANTATVGSCNPSAPVGQGGCDGLTVKNLKITNFCDGIWISGDCSTGSPSGRQGYDANAEYRLRGLVIEGNMIYNNGKANAANVFTPAAGGDGGDWTYRYYNDGIFTAQIGLDEANSGSWKYKECVMGGKEIQGLHCPDGIVPASGDCTAACVNLPADRNFIWHNKIYAQKVVSSISCAGGNGINLQGGIEFVENNLWAGANEIEKNVLKNNAGSGISFTHASIYNRIHGNLVVGNHLGGITNGCAWNSHNYVYYNTVQGNFGVGIGVDAPQKVKNNIVTDTQALDNAQYANLGYNLNGQGILAIDACDTTYTPALCGSGEGSELVGNTVAGNVVDIADSSGATGSENMCMTTTGYADTTPAGFGGVNCQYASGARLNCLADINHDLAVNVKDFQAVQGQWGQSTSCYGLW